MAKKQDQVEIARRQRVLAELGLENCQERFEREMIGALNNHDEWLARFDPDLLIECVELFMKELRRRAEY